MEKSNILDYTKWFLDNNLDNPRNTFKGNMKLQKLLFFAQLISLAKNDKLLFEDNFSAFENGMVIESVRKEYRDNLPELLKYQKNILSKDEIEILELTKNIYGSEDADSLSKMSHEFTYWKKYLDRSNNNNINYNKQKGIIPNEELKKELEQIKDVLAAYQMITADNYKEEEYLDY